MLKVNLARGIVEIDGNDMDYISELETAVWLVKNSIPEEMHEQMREAFEEAMKAGNTILLTYNNYGMDVHIAVGKFDKTKGFDEAFRMYAGEEGEREVYESCIEYLEELIDEGIKDGN